MAQKPNPMTPIEQLEAAIERLRDWIDNPLDVDIAYRDESQRPETELRSATARRLWGPLANMLEGHKQWCEARIVRGMDKDDEDFYDYRIMNIAQAINGDLKVVEGRYQHSREADRKS